VWLQRQLGNQYTASCWTGLAALLERRAGRLAGQRVLLFSYGSGVQASLLVLQGRAEAPPPYTLAAIAAQVRAVCQELRGMPIFCAAVPGRSCPG